MSEAKRVESLEKELEEARNQMLRVQADYENAEKRWIKSQAEFQEMANGELLRQLLEIYDDFERALDPSIDSGRTEVEGFRAGLEMIAKRIQELLKSYGVAPMEAAGKLFDPTQHEAVAHEAVDSVPESTVLEELRKGYFMNGRVLRHAAVKVAVKPENRE